MDNGLDAPAQNHESTVQGDELEPAGAHRGHRARRIPRPIAAQIAAVPVADHDHSPRLCATCTESRYLELRPAPRARISPALVADRIRAAGGDVWPAVLELGVSYSHALAIRAGWRGAGRQVEPIPYTARSWKNGRKNGWSDRALRVLPGGARAARSASA